MTPSNSMCAVPNYGSSASYCDLPTEEQIRAGVVPLDSLPAAWWNAMWACTNGEVNKARDMLGQLIVELNNVLCNAGVCACSSCTDQLYQSINKIRQTLANASVAGAVKSSSQPSEVAVDANGYMSVNCLGNAASLTTSASTVVGAINELKSTYDCCVSDINTALGNKAPTSHASTATTYGVGNADCYGHLKISDTYTSVLSACSGVAASQKAVACVYCYAAGVAAGIIALGNTNGCALGTAAAGTATTAARSDHVHPKQTCVACAGANGSGTAFGSAATCAASAFLAASGCAADSAKLGGRTAAEFIRNKNGADLGVNANLGTYHTMTTSGPSSCWNHLLSMGWAECAGTDTWASQISVPTYHSDKRMAYRCHCNCATNNCWQSWVYLIDTRGGQTINGDLTAATFCGALSGNASTATYATCGRCIYNDSYTADADRNILVSSATAAGYNSQGVVLSGCNFTYNPGTGQLKLKSNGKTACISHLNASFLHIYTDATCVAFNQDIYLPSGKYIDRAKFACCANCLPIITCAGLKYCNIVQIPMVNTYKAVDLCWINPSPASINMCAPPACQVYCDCVCNKIYYNGIRVCVKNCAGISGQCLRIGVSSFDSTSIAYTICNLTPGAFSSGCIAGISGNTTGTGLSYVCIGKMLCGCTACVMVLYTSGGSHGCMADTDMFPYNACNYYLYGGLIKVRMK